VLIERGADVNVQAAGSGLTPLHYAAAGGLVEIARTLLAKGARSDVRSKDGKTPLDLALEKGQSAVAMLLGGG
jgi:ankyrin repeat protein